MPVRGPAREIGPANQSYFTLKEIQQHISAGVTIDADMEVVPNFRYEDGMLFCNAEEIRPMLPVNVAASVLTSQTIRGDVMLVADREWS
jgi:hypothetical protein